MKMLTFQIRARPLNRLNLKQGRRDGSPVGERAFTLIELLVVVTTVALLALTLLPALAASRVNSKAYQCLENERRLTTAWRMYAIDYQDIVPAAFTLQNNFLRRPNWCTGLMDWNPGNPSNWDPRQDIMKSPIWRYVGGMHPYFGARRLKAKCLSPERCSRVSAVIR